jgi:hypothetical protein
MLQSALRTTSTQIRLPRVPMLLAPVPDRTIILCLCFSLQQLVLGFSGIGHIMHHARTRPVHRSILESRVSHEEELEKCQILLAMTVNT